MQNCAKRRRTEQEHLTAAVVAATATAAKPAQRHLLIVWDLDEVRAAQ